jgi:hypothetical protein
MSYTARALEVSGGQNLPTQPCPIHSRADFVQALRMLGTTLTGEARHCSLDDRESEDMQVAFLRCLHTTWLEVFGEPSSAEEHAESLPLFPVQVWKYQCRDGPLECVGHQVDDLYGNRWLTLVRVCFF